MKFQHKQNAGFTIVETMVAISILAIALTGPLAVIAQSLRSSYFSRDQITAYYLAQEAVEHIRNKRDIKGLSGEPSATWLDGITDDDSGQNLINIPGSNAIKAHMTLSTADGYKLFRCSVACPKLKYNSASGIYGDDSTSVESLFTREVILSAGHGDIEVDPISGNPTPKRELVITVRVSWSTGSVANSISIKEHITNWQLERPSDL